MVDITVTEDNLTGASSTAYVLPIVVNDHNLVSTHAQYPTDYVLVTEKNLKVIQTWRPKLPILRSGKR